MIFFRLVSGSPGSSNLSQKKNLFQSNALPARHLSEGKLQNTKHVETAFLIMFVKEDGYTHEKSNKNR